MEDKRDKSYSRSFKDLECWQKAHEFVKVVYQVTKKFPEDERFGLTSQFRRYIILSQDIEYINKEKYEQLEFLINGASWKLNGYAEAVSGNRGVNDE